MKRMVQAIAVAFTLTASGFALAQAPPPKATPAAALPALTPQEIATREEAAARFREGLELFSKSNTEGAYLKFKQAYVVLDNSLDVLWNLAIAELRSKRPLEALRHLRQFVEDPRTPAKDRADAQQYLDEAYGRTGHLTVDGPAGAEVLLDGTPKSMCPMKSDLDVEAEREVSVGVKLGGKSAFAKVTCPAGRKVSVHVEVRGDAIATNVEIGAPGAAGAGAGSEKHAKGMLQPPGEAHAHEGWPTAKTATVIGLGAAGVLGLGLAAVFYGAGKGAANDAAGAVKPSAGYDDARSRYDASRTASTVAFYGGAALGVGALVMAVVWPNKESAPQQGRLVPVFGPQSAGLAGRF
jgi:hypothetical protein